MRLRSPTDHRQTADRPPTDQGSPHCACIFYPHTHFILILTNTNNKHPSLYYSVRLQIAWRVHTGNGSDSPRIAFGT